MKSTWLKQSLVAAALLATACCTANLAVPAAYAQSNISGDITGAVVDSSDAAVPNAKVTVTSLARGEAKTVMTDKVGNFRVPLLSPGKYTIVVEATGFNTAKMEATVSQGVVTPLSVKLAVGQTSTTVEVTAGGRADLEVIAPPAGGGVRVEIGGNSAIVLGTPPAARPAPTTTVDPLTYGSPAPLGFDPGAATRRFDYAIGRSFGFIDGVPGLWWTVNGHLYPDVPMYVVRAGDVVTMHVSNSSGEVHPMHLHGHHAVVLARNGTPLLDTVMTNLSLSSL